MIKRLALSSIWAYSFLIFNSGLFSSYLSWVACSGRALYINWAVGLSFLFFLFSYLSSFVGGIRKPTIVFLKMGGEWSVVKVAGGLVLCLSALSYCYCAYHYMEEGVARAAERRNALVEAGLVQPVEVEPSLEGFAFSSSELICKGWKWPPSVMEVVLKISSA